MFQIKYNNVFLDLAPNQECEIERYSPLFLVDNILAEYSTPVNLVYTDNNARALGYYFFDTTVKVKKTITVEIYDKGSFRYNASLVIESAGMNFRQPSAGTASGYLLIGISNFFITVKDKLLRDLTLGGDRVFNYTTDDALDLSAGYWQHFQDTYNFTHDYVMLPCLNDAFTPDDIEFTNTDGWMNKYDGAKIVAGQPVVPWVKLEYVLQQIFSENGWTLDTSAITDTEWKKLILFSNYTISTSFYTWGGSAVVVTPKSSITINLANAMPADITCSKFVFEICKRYLWAPVCDSASNVCRLIALKDVGSTAPVDYTRYASATSLSQFPVVEKIFAFKNNFIGDDQLPSEPDLKEYTATLSRFSKNLLPDPNVSNWENTLAYTYLENKYWTIYWDGVGNKEWVDYSDNIYNEEPDDATDTFETDVTTLPLKRQLLENGHYCLMPRVDQAPFSAWGIRTVIYHGMVPQVSETGSPLDLTYPYGSSVNVPPGQTPVLPWSNVYKHLNYLTEFGIIEYWAKLWLQLIANTEEITQRFYLPLHVLVKFHWDKIILIRNIGYLFKSFIEPLTYRGFIEAKLQKTTWVTNTPGEVDDQEDVHFTTQSILLETTSTYEALQYLKGPAGATVTMTITTYTKSDIDFYFRVNDNPYFSVGDTFSTVIDGAGLGFYNVKLGMLTEPSSAIFVIVTITAVDMGAIGTPDTAGYDKVR